MSVIKFENVEKSYNDGTLFNNVNLEIPKGMTVGLRGANGSGKSVIMKLMTKFQEPDAGTVTIAPEYLSAKRSFPEKFGVIINKPGYIPSLAGLANLKSLARIRNVIDEKTNPRHHGTSWFRSKAAATRKYYSLGMKQ